MYYKVRKNRKATNRPYSGLWPIIIGKSVNQSVKDRKIKKEDKKTTGDCGLFIFLDPGAQRRKRVLS